MENGIDKIARPFPSPFIIHISSKQVINLVKHIMFPPSISHIADLLGKGSRLYV